MTSTTHVFGSLPMLLIGLLISNLELLLSLIVTTGIILILPHVDALHALMVVPVALVRPLAHDVHLLFMPMLLASAPVVIQQLNIVLIAISVVLLSGAINAFKGKDS